MNNELREHVIEIGFSLTLSKTMMITYLVLIHHFRGDAEALHNMDRKLVRTWVTTMRCLQHRGLITWATAVYGKPTRTGGRPIVGWKPYRLTKAGTLVVNLLKEAGIYQDRLAELGLVAKTTAAA